MLLDHPNFPSPRNLDILSDLNDIPLISVPSAVIQDEITFWAS